jgi:immune inhibitor A
MKRILTVLFGLLFTANMWAVKAYPLPVTVRQPDGSTLTVVLHGDEDFHYYTTLDDVLLVQKDGAYYIGSTTPGGALVATTQLAHDSRERSMEERRLATLQDREAFLSASETLRGMRKMQREPIDSVGMLFFPHWGSPRAVVILAEFQDTTFTIENPKKSFDEYFNATKPLEDHGRGENRNFVSVRQYFKLASQGQYTPDFDVYGPVTLPSPLKTYGGDVGGEGKGERMDLLFQDACYLLNDSIDFSKYDSNKDGYVDLVIVVYAGYSQSMSGNSSECIWPKSGTTSGGTYDGKRVSRFAVSAELNGFPGCWSTAPWERINGIGTLCHELCHTLGLPDFYPTGSAWKGDNQAMEYWSLMDSGNYLTNGYTPCALNAWEREAFGWKDIAPLEVGGEVELKSIDDGGQALRIYNAVDSNEYYVLENIQNIGLNTYQKGHGLIVTHVEYDPTSFSLRSNTPNNIKGHPRMTVVPADGLLFAQYNVGKTIDGKTIKNADFYNELAGDPFPGTKGVTCLNDTMGIVNFQVYNGTKLNKALADITESKDGVVNFTFIDNFDDYLAGISTPSMEPRKSDGRIFTLDGREVQGTLPRGIYIQNGKKVVKWR